MKERVRDIITGVLLHILWIFPVNTKKVIFKSFRGQNCGDSPGAIFQELKKRRPDLHYYWVMRDTMVSIPGATVIKNGSLAELFHLATAKVWVDNKRKGMWCEKRKKQYYIQTWHAGICGKKVEADARGALSEYYLKNAAKDSHNADLFLSDARWTTELYRRSFFYDGEILECGIPRADILYKNQEETKKKVFRFFRLDDDVKLLLYAPTFRVNESLEAYSIDYKRLTETLINKYGGNWKILLRLHPNLARKYKDITIDSDSIIDVSQYQDINELIVASEILITDYSSCMFDAMEAGKIIFLYATDVDEYDQDRGRYFEFSELPFALAVNNDQLAANVQNYDQQLYTQAVKEFSDSLGLLEGGKASDAVCDRIEQVMKQDCGRESRIEVQ